MKMSSNLPLLLFIISLLVNYATQLELVYLVGSQGVRVINMAQLNQMRQLLTPESTIPKMNELHQSSTSVCITKGCVRIAAIIIQNMDETIDPCHDFYKFACGGYIKDNVIPDDKSFLSVWDDIIDHLDERMKLILEKNLASNDSRIDRMTKNLYKSCMNVTQIDELGIQPLLDILMDLGGWPVIESNNGSHSNLSILQILKTMNKIGVSTDILFSFQVETDDKDSSRRIIVLDNPYLGLDREYLIKGINDSVVKAYLQHSTNVAEFLGASTEVADSEMLEMLLFEMELANISTPKEERRNYFEMYNVLSVKDLQAMTTSVPWLEFMNAILPSKAQIKMDENIIVRDLNFFQRFDALINNVNKRTLLNYMIWRVIQEAAPYLSDDISGLDYELQSELYDSSEDSSGWKKCAKLVKENLPYAIGNLYVKNYFNQEAKTATKSIVESLRSSFEDIIRSEDWMDEVTKAKAIDKLKSIRAYIAYPDELLLDSKLEEHYAKLSVDEHSILGNIERIKLFNSNNYYGKLREKVDVDDWKEFGDVADVNAYYSSNDNSIRFPAGVLQGVLFDTEFPQYVNFAGIGWIIGHELTHAFDDGGKQFSSNGTLANWWQPETEQKFIQRAKCIIDQYSNYAVPEIGLHLNGINTEGENIADNGGTKESYMAYQQWVKNNGRELDLPGLSYNTNQLFWITHAQQECAAHRPKYLKQKVLTDEHSPERFRIIGSYSNSKEFANDFNCPVGSLMNPAEKCVVW